MGQTPRTTSNASALTCPPGQERPPPSALPASALPEVGQQFLGFRLLHELGRGAFAVVYLAHQHDLCNRLVALKISTDLSVEPSRLAQLHHTNVVPICSVHRRGHLQAICMPYFGGTTVADVCASLGRQPRPSSGKAIADVVRQRQQQLVKAHGEPACHTSTGLAGMDAMSFVDAVLQLASQLADALSHAHARGIIHRDLKPANVLITDDGQPMLLDFNVADDVKQSSPDLPAYVGGTLPYASPEQLEVLSGTAGQRWTAAATSTPWDSSSTSSWPGGCHSRMRRGRPRKSCPGCCEARRGKPPDLPPAKHISPAVAAIVRHCLEPKPECRYPSAAALKEDLDRQLNNLPLRYVLEPSWSERALKWARRHPRLASALALATEGAVVLLLVVSMIIGLSL